LNELKNILCVKICVLVETPYHECLTRNYARDRIVPINVIEKMYKSWKTSYYFEGWDSIYEVNTKNGILNNPGRWIESVMGFEQHNHHHTMTLGEHCIATAMI
jgi:predicted kinase